jgi:glycosyltransferase involved in cell wall biosynthesis
MSRPLVSVVMPVYNAELFVGEALDSIFAQDYEPFEVVVVDDGSTDGSSAIARSYPELRYIRQENCGPSAARNAGITAARGEIIAVADSDDILLPHKLSVQVGYLIDHPEVAVTLGRQVWTTPPPDAVPDRVWGDLDGIPLVSMVVRKRALIEVGGYDTALRGPEDLDLLIRLRELGHQLVVLPEIVMQRRYHGENLVAGRGLNPLPASLIKAKLDRARAGAAMRGSTERKPRPRRT